MMSPGRGGGLGLGSFLRQQQGALSYLKEGRPPDVRRTLGRVWRLLRPYQWPLLGGSAVMLLGIGIGLLPPLLIRAILSTAIPRHDLHLALLLGAGMVLFPLGGAVLGLGQSYLS